jgi:hypothetical protein
VFQVAGILQTWLSACRTIPPPPNMPLTIAELLNPSDAPVQLNPQASTVVDIRPQLEHLAALSAGGSSFAMQQRLLSIIESLESQPTTLSRDQPIARTFTSRVISSPNVRLNNRTTLSRLYQYPLHYVLEYPETGGDSTVGHLFLMDPNDWQVPDLNIAYSRGAPMGRTLGGRKVFNELMVDADGNKIACTKSHSTCTFIKLAEYMSFQLPCRPRGQSLSFLRY